MDYDIPYASIVSWIKFYCKIFVTEVPPCHCYSISIDEKTQPYFASHKQKFFFNLQTYYMKNNSIKLIVYFIFFNLCVLFFTLHCNFTCSFAIPQGQDYATSLSRH